MVKNQRGRQLSVLVVLSVAALFSATTLFVQADSLPEQHGLRQQQQREQQEKHERELGDDHTTRRLEDSGTGGGGEAGGGSNGSAAEGSGPGANAGGGGSQGGTNAGNAGAGNPGDPVPVDTGTGNPGDGNPGEPVVVDAGTDAAAGGGTGKPDAGGAGLSEKEIPNGQDISNTEAEEVLAASAASNDGVQRVEAGESDGNVSSGGGAADNTGNGGEGGEGGANPVNGNPNPDATGNGNPGNNPDNTPQGGNGDPDPQTPQGGNGQSGSNVTLCKTASSCDECTSVAGTQPDGQSCLWNEGACSGVNAADVNLDEMCKVNVVPPTTEGTETSPPGADGTEPPSAEGGGGGENEEESGGGSGFTKLVMFMAIVALGAYFGKEKLMKLKESLNQGGGGGLGGVGGGIGSMLDKARGGMAGLSRGANNNTNSMHERERYVHRSSLRCDGLVSVIEAGLLLMTRRSGYTISFFPCMQLSRVH